MSEYQCYEFVALDQPLTPFQMAELRAISTRAEISPTRFWNEYQWGDLKADPAKLVERCPLPVISDASKIAPPISRLNGVRKNSCGAT